MSLKPGRHRNLAKAGSSLKAILILGGLGSSAQFNVSGRTALKMGDAARIAAVVLRN